MISAEEKIRLLVGNITKEQLRYVDCFVGNSIGVFMPAGGACFYALTPLHSHPAYMFFVPFNEETQVKIYGGIIQAEPGRVFILAPDIPHQELPSDSPPRYIAIMVRKELFEAQLAHYKLRNLDFTGTYYNLSPGLIPLVKTFMIEADNRLPGSAAVIDGLEIEICHSLIRGAFSPETPVDRVSSRIEVNRVVEHIQSNLDRKLTVDELASAAGMSKSHFTRVFKAETGSSPIYYITQARLARARKLLIAGDKNITEVALECGFGSPSYLTQKFSEKFKITPSQYLKDLKKHNS